MINKKIIVSHQPQYFPYLETYNKILQSEKFMILDDVKFKKSAWHARTIIKDRNDNIISLIIPCKKNSLAINIKDVKISDHKWKKKHLKIIENIYKNTKYFNEVFEIILFILTQKSEFVSDYTNLCMKIFLERLGYNKKKIFIQSHEKKIDGKKNIFLINLTKKLGGDTYLSGSGGKNYINEDEFKLNNLKHIFNSFNHPKYYQFGNKFIEKLSIIDAAFNLGFSELSNILTRYEKK